MNSAVPRGFGATLLAAALVFAATFLSQPGVAEASEPWQGTVATDSINVRSAPNSSAPRVGVLERGQPVTVLAWVTGEEIETQNSTWAQLGEGRYVYSALIRKNDPKGPPPLPGGIQSSGKWIDVNVTQQVLTAYEGDKPVHVMVISSGRPEYPTPQGLFTILRRVPSATMDSSSVPWVRDSYRLDNVLYTQYFTELGAALHLAWWKREDSFGIPTSHGCIGMPLKEALWLWNWAEVGTPLHIHP